MIHCIGDSHSSIFSGNDDIQPIWPNRSDDKLEHFRSYRLGPATAYQLENKIPIINNIIQTVNTGSDNKFLFCFGEVDIRAHLIKQAFEQGREMIDIVEECVNRYMSVIMYYKTLGLKVMVWGPIASWHPDRPYSGPSYGTCQERNYVTQLFSDFCERLCKEEGIPFISIFNDMVDDNLMTKHEYLDNFDECHMHLNTTVLPIIIERFKEQRLI